MAKRHHRKRILQSRQPMLDNLEARVLLASAVGGMVWSDLSGDGIRQAGELGRAGVTVRLFSSSDLIAGNGTDAQVGAAQLTTADGQYAFTGLPAGNYYIQVSLPAGTSFTLQNQGGNDTLDSDIAPGTGRSDVITVADGQAFSTLDAGLVGTGGSFGLVWGIGSTGSDKASAVALDDDGNLYVAGLVAGTADFDPNGTVSNLSPTGATLYVARYTSAGALVWAHGFVETNPGTGLSDIVALGVGDGAVYVAGTFVDTVDFNPNGGGFTLTATGGQDIFLTKFDLAGNFGWAAQFGTNNEADSATDLRVDTDGRVYLLGRVAAETDVDPSGAEQTVPAGSFVARYLPDGSLDWSTTLPGFGTSLELDAANHTFVGGDHVTRIDADGHTVWSQPMGSDTLSATDITVDHLGNIFLLGGFTGTADFDPGAGTAELTSLPGVIDGYLLKLDADGAFVWVRQIAGAVGANATPLGLRADTAGNIFAIGILQNGTYDFDPGSATRNLTADPGGPTAFLAQFNAGGELLMAVALNSTGHTLTTKSLAIDAAGAVYFAGVYYGTVDFDPSPTGTHDLFSNAGTPDAFVLKLNPVAPSLSGLVWFDADEDGLKDEGETVAPGVTVQLFNASDVLVAQQVTDLGGLYHFAALTPGYYYTVVTPPAGFVFRGTPAPGGTSRDFNRTGLAPVTAGQMTANADFGLLAAAEALGDRVWVDTNGNGIQDDGEGGLAGVIVKLMDAVNGTIGDADDLQVGASVTTDQDGLYAFTGIAPGTYYVAFTLPAGYVFTLQGQGTDGTGSDASPATGRTALLAIASGQLRDDIDAGAYQPGSIAGTIWNDTNGDGIRQNGEIGLPNVPVQLWKTTDDTLGNEDDTQVGTDVMSGVNGNYQFTALAPGSYYIVVVPTEGLALSPQDAGDDDAKDSDVDPDTGRSASQALVSGSAVTLDAGLSFTSPLTTTLTADPLQNGKTVLTITGLSTADNIAVGLADGRITITHNGQPAGNFLVTGRIVINGGAGDDVIIVSSAVKLPVFVFGGAGNDSILGGGGGDVLVGGIGNDTLKGGGGRDVLIGGKGADVLAGGVADDILIGGDWKGQTSQAKLWAIRREWVRNAAYGVRVSRLGNGGGFNGSTRLNAASVVNDKARDRLQGAAGLDLFAPSTGDTLVDKAKNELW